MPWIDVYSNTPTATCWLNTIGTTSTPTCWPTPIGTALAQVYGQQIVVQMQAYRGGTGSMQRELTCGWEQPGNLPAPPDPGGDDRRAAASERARGLLLSMLSRKEKREFAKDKTITVKGNAGGRYRIKWGRTANIEVLHGRRVDHRLCIHPVDPSLPIEDVMLAQILHLKTDEAEVLRIANRHP